jgi:hypothetical protein
MTSADLVYGERRFGQTYAIRVLWALLMLGPLLLAWSVVGQTESFGATRPGYTTQGRDASPLPCAVVPAEPLISLPRLQASLNATADRLLTDC